LVDREGRPVSEWRAFTRYLLAWLWFLPALAVLRVWGMHAPGEIFGVLLAGIAGYALSARLSPERQFLHDIVCGTRLVTHHARR
jgi:uncharacterized RDD family membrane protein YckC